MLSARKSFPVTIKEVIEECDELIVNDREKYWIRIYKYHWEQDLCNHTLGGDGGDTFSSRKHKQSTKDKISKANKGRKRKDLAEYNAKNKSKRIEVYNLDKTQRLALFDSAKFAADYYKMNKDVISRACRTQNPSNGLYFFYVD